LLHDTKNETSSLTKRSAAEASFTIVDVFSNPLKEITFAKVKHSLHVLLILVNVNHYLFHKNVKVAFPNAVIPWCLVDRF
jgi:hypothetical protein